MLRFVEKLEGVQPYRLTLRFNNGEVRVANLERMLRTKATSPSSAYARLLEPAIFSTARLDADSRTICWDGLAREVTADGTEQPAPLDLCPDVLYELSQPAGYPEGPGQPQESSAMVFKEEPRRPD
ncbi:MAG TPA: DUF2442 domain-containing protein [Verrucomicrobiae bacterium]|nr:DUF2442 domain-containing protein [Verrucomicrobiae bacterium]